MLRFFLGFSDQLKHSQDSEGPHDCAQRTHLNVEEGLSDYANQCEHDDQEVKDIPAVSEVLFSKSDELDSELNGVDDCENVVDEVRRSLWLCRLKQSSELHLLNTLRSQIA